MSDRGFTGLWIPREILEDKKLKLTEKCLLAVIIGLAKDGACTASNQYLAEILDISKDRLRHKVHELEADGYVRILEARKGPMLTTRKIIPSHRVAENSHGVAENSHGVAKNAVRVAENSQGGGCFQPGGWSKIATNNIDNNIVNNIDNKRRGRRGGNTEGWAKVVDMYQNNIHPIPNDVELDDLTDLFDEFGADWLAEAIKTAARNRAQSIRYISAVLRNWKNIGGSEPWKQPKAKGKGWKAKEPVNESDAFERAYVKVLAEEQAEEEAERRAKGG